MIHIGRLQRQENPGSFSPANPNPPQSVKLQGAERLYRLRVGDYRIVCEIDRESKKKRGRGSFWKSNPDRESLKRESRKSLCKAILGRDVDVFDLAARWRDRKAILLEAFQVKLDGLTYKRFGFCYSGAGGDAPRQIGNVRRVIYRGLFDHNGVPHPSVFPFSNRPA